MRFLLPVVLAGVVVTVSGAAFAGNLTFADGKAQWQSTICTEPSMPQPLSAVNSETRASEMNVLVESYNFYAGKMQEYMDCVGNESQSDSATAAQAISQSAQTTVQAAQQKVDGLRQSLQTKKR